MPDPEKIPHLLKLLNDESSIVRESVMKELVTFGSSLRDEILRMVPNIEPVKIRHLNKALDEFQKERLLKEWPGWFDLKENPARLEMALELLARYQSGLEYQRPLQELLDALADEYRSEFAEADAQDLALFLFQTKKLKGNSLDYYNPQNSNLYFVITERLGIPISLACVYILVGARLGLRIEGCAIPGHFMASIDLQGRKTLVDCFYGGRLITLEDALEMGTASLEEIEAGMKVRADSAAIIRRILNNLIRAYQLNEQADNRRLMMDLLKVLDKHLGAEHLDNL